MIAESKDTNIKSFNSILFSAINWPRNNREGRKIVTSSYYESIIDFLDKCDDSQVSFYIWKKLLSVTVNVAKFESFESWALVHRCCRALLNHNEMNEVRMDATILRIGLQVAEITKDPKLAGEVVRAVGINEKAQKNDDEFDQSQNYEMPHQPSFPNIPPSTYAEMIKMCIEAGCNKSADGILRHSIRCIDPSNNMLGNLYSLVMNGYAQSGDLQNTEKMLDEMSDNGLVKSEQAYATLIHAYGMNKMQVEALDLLHSMQDGSLGDHIKPGLSSFTACIFAAMRNNDWEQVLRINNLMVESDVQPSSTTFQSILMANIRLGDIEGSVEAMEAAIASNLPIDKNMFQLCSKNLLPKHCGDGNLDSMRKEMRKLATDDTSEVVEEAMDLNKTLRECLRQEGRQASNVKSEIMIQKEKERLWRHALQQTIQLSRKLSD